VTRVLVTGASGFVGRATCAELARRGFSVTGAVRSGQSPLVQGVDRFVAGDIAQRRAWTLQGFDAVVHLAGIAHQLGGQDAESVYQTVNCDATAVLARAAAAARVRRFVFVSSIKVNGEGTDRDRPFRADDVPQPADRYALPKWAAEQALANVAAETGLEVAIVRPPLVYGPGMRANFRRLVQLVRSGLPMPFASINNRRSLVYVGNLADVLVSCVFVAAAKGKTFLVSDGDDLSTPELVRRIGAALGRTVRLFPFPAALLPGKLTQSLVVDAAATRRALAWQPRFGVDAALALSVR